MVCLDIQCLQHILGRTLTDVSDIAFVPVSTLFQVPHPMLAERFTTRKWLGSSCIVSPNQSDHIARTTNTPSEGTCLG